MKRKEFKEKLFLALDEDVDGISYDEKMMLVHSLLVEYEKENEEKRDTTNKGAKWTDEELNHINGCAHERKLRKVCQAV